MSDAPAAPVTENGVPPAAQDQVVEETPGFKVFAGNLAYSTTDEGLRTFFAPVESEILSAQVILRGTRSAGYGFVAVATETAAQKAVELLNKQELDGREVIVEVAKPADQKDKEKKQRKLKRKPGRRGSKAVPGEVSEAEANGDVAKAEGAPATEEGAKPKKKKKSSRSKKARKAAAADGATEGEGAVSGTEVAADGTTPEAAAKKPRVRKPRAPRPARPAGEDPVGEPSKSVLFVANLGFNIDDEGLAKLFTDADLPVVSARIVRRRWGKPRKSKGFGFVDVGDEENQQKAIEVLQGQEVEGRNIAVKIAVNSQIAEEGQEGDADADAAAPTTEREATPETTVVAS